MKFKLCKDCKFCKNGNDPFSTCLRTSKPFVHPVTGAIVNSRPTFCSVERMDVYSRLLTDHCGPEAVHFEPKPPKRLGRFALSVMKLRDSNSQFFARLALPRIRITKDQFLKRLEDLASASRTSKADVIHRAIGLYAQALKEAEQGEVIQFVPENEHPTP